ncbi:MULTISPECIES: glycoside hydrolase family 43 protein [unclassified Campylobacter]|uniref:glycoside hydrolase family 43 protein n=1 Tax=unclassified Campylobacter TaxID=2593542 RepID=UPI0022E9C667|nr:MULTISPECIES: glycoside hydrolase family 43 protein [unclassified Campylobacter]MDA3043938.1 glycoside hydrolase family 43 protein [Campylobacter sp. JMF_09 ED2]MDA3045475.1 glycoside hydrolase family 43 protein [Campylobacter sp. JMF_07 ED4]MDA3064105.1 glycoside hydrolase family 43 protein [Campylobacter sp. JMF_11 EL3]MDA3072023.1 glycoside hydrolase family 43 protein [Campylobacter sp. VBCF_03 NA9]MDA3075712.1 glycoside hydrolase family 43 protein [Campylobacter sp. JMF_05 ED3]
MFAYFVKEKDGLHLAYSYDGYKWIALNNNKSILKPNIGKDKLMRDPSLIYVDKTFHLVWTTSWNDRIIGYTSSKDMINFEKQEAIPVMLHESKAQNVWAPDLFFDETTSTFYILYSTTILGRHKQMPTSQKERKYNHRIYVTTTKNFQDFSISKLYFDPNFMPIDATVIKNPKNNMLIMFVKNENSNPAEKNIRVTFSNSMQKGFPVDVSNPINFGSDWVEGPAAIFIGKELFVYFDNYRNKKFNLVVSNDGGISWQDRTDKLSLPDGIRHGSVIKVNKKIVQNLIKKYGSE